MIRPACTPATAHLFSSLDVSDHMRARAICGACPMVQACISKAVEIAAEQNHSNPMYRGPDGTWGGLLWKGGTVLDLDNMPRIHKRKEAA